jgi:dihydroxyacetone kinase-like protein
MTRIKDAVEHIAKAIIAQKDYLNMLDKAIGDGDHGNNMAIGFEAALEEIDNMNDDGNPAKVFKLVHYMQQLSTVQLKLVMKIHLLQLIL